MAQWYVDYLASCDWREKRERIFRERSDEKGPVCEDCRRVRKGLTLHHITYARVLEEHDEDFRILCAWCHRRAHRTHDIPYLWAIYQPRDENLFRTAANDPPILYPQLRVREGKRRRAVNERTD